ncbi:PadR family transcriptional regulator [bacterium]|nr:PadR family transcriptional regulator [bacterium]
MIEIIILYILNKYDCSIYRLSKIIDELFFAFQKTSAGTINPALKRLENLSCVEYRENMSEGGMKTKIYSITKAGKKHISSLLLNLEYSNPSRFLNDIKMALFCSDILSKEELKEFRENILNLMDIYKIKLEKGLKNEYIQLNELQRKTVEITLKDINELIKNI